MDNLEPRFGTIIVTHRTPIYEALAEMTRTFFAYWFQVDANSEMAVVMTFEIRPIYEPGTINHNDRP